MATYSGALSAIKDRMRSNWSETPILFENERSAAVDEAAGALLPWVEFVVMADQADGITIGNPAVHVISGAIEVTVFVPDGTGNEIAVAHAEAIGSIFRRQDLYRSQAGYVRTQTPLVGPGSRVDTDQSSGPWWAVAVTVPFAFYHEA